MLRNHASIILGTRLIIHRSARKLFNRPFRTKGLLLWADSKLTALYEGI